MRHLPELPRHRGRELKMEWTDGEEVHFDDDMWPAGQPIASGARAIDIKLEDEAIDDVHMLPETPGALAREWRSFDRQGSALGALVNLGWVALAACLALLAQSVVQRALSIRVCRLLRLRPEEPTLGLLLRLLLCDLAGLGVFSGVFIYSRHWLMNAGVGVSLIIFSVNVLIRWRVWALTIGIVLRPDEPAARGV